MKQIILAALLACVSACACASAAAPAPPPEQTALPPPSSSAQKLYSLARNDLLQVRVLLKNGHAQASVGSGFLIGASNLFQQHWKLLLLIPVIVPLAFYLSGKHPRIRYLRDLAFIKTPILKLIMYNKLVAVFAELFRILIVAGMTIDRVFDLTIPALGNEYFRVKLLKAKENILNGRMISESLKEQDILPLLVIRMINIGEASGTLDNQLEFLAKHYTKKLDDATDSMGKLIEPLVMVVVGGLFAVIILGLMLPIYDLVSKIK